MTMRRLLTLILACWTLLLGGVPLAAAQTPGSPDKAAWLTENERAWLREHPAIKLAPAPDFPPVEFFDDQGQYRGIAADYVAEIEAMLGIRFEIVQVPTWTEAVRRAQAREVDVWPEAAVTPAREAYMSFTRPYLELPAVIIVRNDDIDRTNMDELAGRRVAVVRDYAIHDWLTSNHPRIEAVPVANIEEGLRLVSYGQADAIIEANAPAIYYIERNGFTNLHVAGDSGFVWRLAMGVRSDWQPLRDILQKALDRISARRKTEIFHNWVALKQYGWAPSKSLLLSLGAAFVMVFIAAVLAWNRSLKRLVDVRTRTLEQKLREVESAEQSAYRKERSFNQLFNAADFPLALHELNGDLIQLNEQALELFDLRVTDLEQVHFPRDFMPSDIDISDLASLWERVVSGHTERFEWNAVQPHSGRPLRLRICCRRIELPGRDGVLSSIRRLEPEPPQSASSS